jgi:hypothetical protein
MRAPADGWLAASWQGYPKSQAAYSKFAGVGFVNVLGGRLQLFVELML